VIVAATLAAVCGMLLVGLYICRSRTNLKGKITLLCKPLHTYGSILPWNHLIGLLLLNRISLSICKIYLFPFDNTKFGTRIGMRYTTIMLNVSVHSKRISQTLTVSLD